LSTTFLLPERTAAAVRQVWAERNDSTPPVTLLPLPGSWPARYEHLVYELGLDTRTFSAAVGRIQALWALMFPPEEA
jgi:hypothetical protein